MMEELVPGHRLCRMREKPEERFLSFAKLINGKTWLKGVYIWKRARGCSLDTWRSGIGCM